MQSPSLNFRHLPRDEFHGEDSVLGLGVQKVGGGN